MTLASIYVRSAASGVGEMHSISAEIATATVWLMRGVPEDDEEEEDDDKKHGDDEAEDEDDDGEGYSE
jgi:hypothetical protein